MPPIHGRYGLRGSEIQSRREVENRHLEIIGKGWLEPFWEKERLAKRAGQQQILPPAQIDILQFLHGRVRRDPKTCDGHPVESAWAALPGHLGSRIPNSQFLRKTHTFPELIGVGRPPSGIPNVTITTEEYPGQQDLLPTLHGNVDGSVSAALDVREVAREDCRVILGILSLGVFGKDFPPGDRRVGNVGGIIGALGPRIVDANGRIRMRVKAKGKATTPELLLLHSEGGKSFEIILGDRRSRWNFAL